MISEKLRKFLNRLTDGFIDTFGSLICVLYNIILFVFGASIFALTIRGNLMFYIYIFLTLFFLYIPSYFGQEILSTSEDLLYDLFSSEWIEADLKYKKSMIIFMENLKQPIRMKILIFDYLNLSGFQNVRKFSV